MERARKFDHESHDSFDTESTSEVESHDNKKELNSSTFCKDKNLSDREEGMSLMEEIPLTHPIPHNELDKTVEAEMELNGEVQGEASGCELREESDETNGTTLTPSSKTSLKSHILGVLRCGHRQEPVSNEMDYIQPASIRPGRTSHILRVLRRSSLLAVGLAVLVVGGVSSNFHPHVDPGEYENCTVTRQLIMNDTSDW